MRAACSNKGLSAVVRSRSFGHANTNLSLANYQSKHKTDSQLFTLRVCLNLLPSGLYRRLRPFTESTLLEVQIYGLEELSKGHGLDPSSGSYRRSGIGAAKVRLTLPRRLLFYSIVAQILVGNAAVVKVLYPAEASTPGPRFYANVLTTTDLVAI